MTINKYDLVAIAESLRNKKDQLKKKIKAGEDFSIVSENELIIPPLQFKTSVDLESDKWMFNGFVLRQGQELIVTDPGVDFYTRFTVAGLSPLDIRTLILTHGHTDHCADMTVFIEKILRNKAHKIQVFIAKTAFESEIPRYHQKQLLKKEHIDLVLLSEVDNEYAYKLTNGMPINFIPLYHSTPDTYGFKIKIGEQTFGYVSDTGYSKTIKTDKGIFSSAEAKGQFVQIEEKHTYIKDFYSDVDTLVVNINDLQYNRHSEYHLSGWDVLDFLLNSKIKRLVLQHLSPVNAEGEDSNYIYKLFFADQHYETILPHYLGRKVSL